MSGTNEYFTGLAFSYYDPDNSNALLEVMDENGKNKHTIVMGEIGVYDFEWSKDGTKLIYSISSGDSSAIYLYDFRLKTNQQLYSSTNEVLAYLDVSYDQSTITFSIRDSETNTGSIAIMSINGKNFEKIVNGISYQLCYSIDDRIYFIKDDNIYSVNDDGSDILQITPEDDNRIFRYNVSPTGESIIYSRFNESGILLQCDQYGNRHQILFSIDSIAVSGLDYIAEPKFSPDGSMIYFGHKSKLISFYDIQTKRIRHIYFGESNIYNIWWIPGTEKLVYTTNENMMFNILSIGTDGKSKIKLFEFNSGSWDLRISPVKMIF